VWKIRVPPRIQVFLWLLLNNKVLTRDNLAKRKKNDDLICLFCSDLKSVKHLFFECCVVSSIWDTVSEMLGFRVGVDFESIAKLWLMDKKCKFINIFYCCDTLVFMENTKLYVLFGWGRKRSLACVRARYETGVCCSENRQS
jgi:hypothetical protein